MRHGVRNVGNLALVEVSNSGTLIFLQPQAQVQVLQGFKWPEQRLYSTSSGPQNGSIEESEQKET